MDRRSDVRNKARSRFSYLRQLSGLPIEVPDASNQTRRYLRHLSKLPIDGSDVRNKARSRFSYLRQLSRLWTERSGSWNGVGKKIRRHGRLMSCFGSRHKKRGERATEEDKNKR